MKTLIELFDVNQLENVVAALRLKPEKIVFIGFRELMNQKKISSLEHLFRLRGFQVQLEYHYVNRYDYAEIIHTLETVVDVNKECCFDLTGGMELVLAAMGAVSAKRNIPMFQFNLYSGKFIRVSGCDDVPQPPKESLSIRETIVLHGGEIFEPQQGKTEWNFNSEFKNDIKTIWNISKIDSTRWNQFANTLESGVEEPRCKVRLFFSSLSSAKQETLKKTHFFEKLEQAGLIKDLRIQEREISFAYKNEQIKRCMAKAGNVLELYACVTAMEINEAEPGYFDDIDIGVFLDWDGRIFPIRPNEKETRNEIDVFLMQDMIPVFISCKNGEVHKEDLYELETVSERFAGKYSKKLLLTNGISSNKVGRDYILQRARDMGIGVICDINQMSEEEFFDTFKKKLR